MNKLDTRDCDSPWYLPEGHSQTIYSSQFTSYPSIQFTRERIDTPDNDFIDIDWNIPGINPDVSDSHPNLVQIAIDRKKKHYVRWLQEQEWLKVGTGENNKALLMFHGLEGNSASPYAQSICHYFRSQGWIVVVAHFRGCSGEINRLARSYFSGDSADVDFVTKYVQSRFPQAQWHACGISMGGNALLKYTGEQQESSTFKAVAAISAPLDLSAAGFQISSGIIGKNIYTPYFLKSMISKVELKATLFPMAIDLAQLRASKTILDFDNAYTAKVHGFRNGLDYWQRCSSKPYLKSIRIPALVLNARNDPFVPEASLPGPNDVSDYVLLHQPANGGHTGFTSLSSSLDHPQLWMAHRLKRFFEAGR